MSISNETAAGSAARVAQGVLTSAAFAGLLAGTNATTPILPLYRQVLGFTPFMLTLTFVCYVSTLVVVLLAVSRPWWSSKAALLICAALGLAVVADVLLSTAGVAGILVGRALAGVAGGLGTGAASALVVVALGERGRSVSATGSMAGGVVGTALSQAVVSRLGPEAMHWTFLMHAAFCVTMLALLSPFLFSRRLENSTLLTATRGSDRDGPWLRMRQHPIPIAIGCLCWILISLLIVLFPSLSAEIGMPSMKDYGVLTMLIASSAGQLLSPQLSRGMPWMSGIASILLGISSILTGLFISHPAVVFIGMIALGFGTGLAYRLSLVVLCRGIHVAAQGGVASLYAALTYGAAAIAVLASGGIANVLGVQEIMIVLLLLLMLALATILHKAPRLKMAI